MTARLLPALKSSLFPSKPKAAGKKRRANVVRKAAKGALLAAGLAITQTEDDDLALKWRLFDPGLFDRLSAPLTRYHE